MENKKMHDDDIFDSSHYDMILIKTAISTTNTTSVDSYEVKYTEWQKIVTEILPQCSDCNNRVEIGNVIDYVMVEFDRRGIQYKDPDGKGLVNDSKISDKYKPMNINLLIYGIFKYMLYLDDRGYIMMVEKSPSKYTDYILYLGQ